LKIHWKEKKEKQKFYKFIFLLKDMQQLSLMLLFLLGASASPIGCIANVTFISPNIATILNNLTLEQCMCQIYQRNASGFNYLMHNDSCQLFTNFTTNYALVVNAASKFCFTTQPPSKIERRRSIALHDVTYDLSVPPSQPTTEPLDLTTSETIPTTTDRPLQWNPVGVTVASGSGSASVLDPFGVFVDDNYFIYIAEKSNSRISKWPPNPSGGVTSPLYRSATGELNAPPSLYADSSTGDIYVADENNRRVRVFHNGSTIGVTIVSSTAGLTPNVNALFLDPNRTIFISDSANNRVYNWLTNQTAVGGNGAGSNANQLNQPKRFFIDKNFQFYVPNGGSLRVQKWMLGASVGQTVAGGNGSGQAQNQLGGAIGAVADSQGNVLVCDSTNNRIQKWAPGATTGETVAGSAACVAGSGLSQLTSPRGIAIDKDDNLYVADGGTNYRVQRFNAV
jgi:hypothetical protein